MYDPLDPASWEGYDVPLGGWSRGLSAAQGRGAGATASGATSGAAATAPAHPPGKALPSPGDILRMNAAAQGGTSGGAASK